MTEFRLNSCQTCGAQLAPDDFDGICSECDRKFCEGCGAFVGDRDECPECGEENKNNLPYQENQ